ncbi:phosphotransferase enzyme family protein [Roseibacillus ishigakijimensis]|uniref:Aminoglycoside phosphotransferase family protein n=1 Tax=Roseibacillus ishigakijimensis TaxID=454146 RepID=A0A934RL01_9BACT|nr:aminoglycoside phosphotransferase family protein [Roseibacillus ishigakijimensis]MBK1832778.1 aminoglycoside phosphotransferase family protein [Roseibacillus ishigakijimensis]
MSEKRPIERIEEIANLFAIEGHLIEAEEVETGLINSTWLATYQNPRGQCSRFILQRINETVFGDPLEVMRNVECVTRHINEKVLRVKKDFGGHTLSLYPGRKGSSFVKGPHGGIWRCYNFIEGCRTYDVVENTRQAYQAGHAFGAFQDLVSDLSPQEIIEVIPDFHNTPKRYENLLQAVAVDECDRVREVQAELAWIESMAGEMDKVTKLVAAGELPVRVTHNDTKINNVLFDMNSDEAMCVIDLDTVMPGLSLYDFGDLVRTSTNPAAEDERDLEKVCMRMPIFEALVEGYLEAVGEELTRREIELLPFSGCLISLELGMRFLTDYLSGDRYFRVKRPGQNLDRARTQLKLAREIAAAEDRMQAYVDKVASALFA